MAAVDSKFIALGTAAGHRRIAGRRAGPEDEDVLRAARAALLAEHPQIAARNTVTNLVVQQPLAFAAGGVGLVLAVIAVGRGLFRLVF